MSEKEANSRQTSFVKKQLENAELNIWLGEVKGDTIFKLSTMGKSALKDHSDEKKQQSEVKKIKTFFLPVNKSANKLSS